jgi:hypothetical protein
MPFASFIVLRGPGMPGPYDWLPYASFQTVGQDDILLAVANRLPAEAD